MHKPLTIFLTLLALVGARVALDAGTVRASDASREATGASFAIRAGRIHTMDPKLGTIDDGTLLVIDGKVAAVGREVDVPSWIPIHHHPHASVIPGLVAASSSLADARGRSGREDSVAAQFRAVDGFDPYADYASLLANGVTTAFLEPGHERLVAGRGAVVKLHGGRVLAADSHLVVHLGEEAYGPPDKQEIPFPSSSDVPIEPAEKQRPTSRISQFAELEANFEEADRYAEARAEGSAPYDARLAALSRSKDLPARVHAERAADILHLVRHRQVFGGGVVLSGATEAHRVAEAVAAGGFPVIVEIPYRFDAPAPDRGRAPDRLDATLATAAALDAAGVRVAIATPSGARTDDLPMAALSAVRGGLPIDKALAGITREAARALGVDDRVGTLAPGRDADLVLLSGQPLTPTARVASVWVDGRPAYRAESSALVVRAGHVATGDEIVRDGAVLIEDGKITAVGRTVPTPRGARTIDAGSDAWITPGFIDAHGHLGLEGDRTPPDPDLSLADAIATARAGFADVAAAGVTTVVLSPYAANRNGSQIAAIKTAGSTRDEIVVADPVGMLFSARNGDPLSSVRSIRTVLDKGRKYVEQWKKYEESLAKWEKEQEDKKKAEADAKKKQQEEERKKEEEKKNGESEDPAAEEEPEEKVDPLSGTWAITLSGGPLPEPQSGEMKLKLEGSSVTGSIVSPIGGDTSITGSFDGTTLDAEVDVDTPFGPPRLVATLERPDFLRGSFAIGDVFSLDLTANRTEKEVPEIKVKRRKKSEDGRPLPPPVNEALEPVRAMIAGDAVAAVDAGSTAQIDALLSLFAEYEIAFVLINGEGAAPLADKLAETKTGVVVPKSILATEDRRTIVPSDRLGRAGVPIAFQSDAEDGARSLPLQVSYAVYQGLDASTALRALTVDAARMFRIDDRVGNLAAGRDGDLLIFSGPPFDAASRLEHVIVSGKELTP